VRQDENYTQEERVMNVRYAPNELQISVDVGSVTHSVAISDGFGSILQALKKYQTLT